MPWTSPGWCSYLYSSGSGNSSGQQFSCLFSLSENPTKPIPSHLLLASPVLSSFSLLVLLLSLPRAPANRYTLRAAGPQSYRGQGGVPHVHTHTLVPRGAERAPSMFEAAVPLRCSRPHKTTRRRYHRNTRPAATCSTAVVRKGTSARRRNRGDAHTSTR